MGFLKRRRERESAIPPGTVDAGSIPTAPEPAPVATAEPPPEAEPAPAAAAEPTPEIPPARAPHEHSIAEEVAAAVGGDMATKIQRLESLMNRHSVNLSGRPMEVREAVVADLNAGGVPAKLGEPMAFTDPKQIDTVVEVLKKHKLLPENASLDAG